MSETKENCENCRFKVNEECHRSFPQLVIESNECDTIWHSEWPDISKTDWCGEWKKSGKAVKQEKKPESKITETDVEKRKTKLGWG